MHTYGYNGCARHGRYHKTINNQLCYCCDTQMRRPSGISRIPFTARYATPPRGSREEAKTIAAPVTDEAVAGQAHGVRTEPDDRRDELEALPDAAALSELFDYDLDSLSEQPALDRIVAAVNRLADTVTGYIEAANAKKASAAEPCGLLRFREWWELVEVVLVVGGKQITGMPVYIEDGALRVINREYSYFIPLKNVEYIRTGDGLCPESDA